jgi:amphi-Trp domain-containing protein
MKRKSRDIEKTYTAEQFAEKLRRLADAVETKRAFTIQVAGERLRIPADARFNIEHEREGSREELEFQLLWKRSDS